MQEELFESIKENQIKKKMPSGKRNEDITAAVFIADGWKVQKQFIAGFKPGKRTKHRVDFLASKGTIDILVSCKYQDTTGTAFEKLPYEYISLLNAVENNAFTGGYLVLFGEVLRRENMFGTLYGSEMSKYMRMSSKIIVCSFEELVRSINRGSVFCE